MYLDDLLLVTHIIVIVTVIVRVAARRSAHEPLACGDTHGTAWCWHRPTCNGCIPCAASMGWPPLAGPA